MYVPVHQEPFFFHLHGPSAMALPFIEYPDAGGDEWGCVWAGRVRMEGVGGECGWRHIRLDGMVEERRTEMGRGKGIDARRGWNIEV
jgi:hypothetical protein